MHKLLCVLSQVLPGSQLLVSADEQGTIAACTWGLHPTGLATQPQPVIPVQGQQQAGCLLRQCGCKGSGVAGVGGASGAGCGAHGCWFENVSCWHHR